MASHDRARKMSMDSPSGEDSDQSNSKTSKATLHKNVMKKLSNKISQYSDVTFIIGNGENTQKYECIKHYFAAQSTIFHNMLYGQMIESKQNCVIIQDITPKSFEYIHGVFCGFNPDLTYDFLIDVWYTSNKYLLTDIMNECILKIEKLDSLCDLFIIIYKMSKYPDHLVEATLLKHLMSNEFVTNSARLIMKRQRFLKLFKSNHVEALLKHTKCKDEKFKFEQTRKWAQYQHQFDWVLLFRPLYDHIDYIQGMLVDDF